LAQYNRFFLKQFSCRQKDRIFERAAGDLTGIDTEMNQCGTQFSIKEASFDELKRGFC
jgi:hypothetical protein